ncbi:putative allantoate permease [Thelonectria olida]|uniref:Allantoate permease n=1 Tax=Thelonectria olida TaxID=1576542 RepID=A0A9P9AUD9_9HYPO|nr:putative allantoate permease [Thelonectria olida]
MVGSMSWARLVQRWPQHVGKFISAAVCLWSSIALFTLMPKPLPQPLCFNFGSIMAARFFLGLVEIIIGPVFVIVTSNWWTRREQVFRTAFWLGSTPVSFELIPLLAFVLTVMQIGNFIGVNGTIATWNIFFLFFGSLSLAFSLWLSKRERKVAIERVRENQAVTSDDHWKWKQF